jgi:hypothetical protein
VLRVVVIDVEGIRTFSAIGCIGVWIKFMRTSIANVVYCFCLSYVLLVITSLRVAILTFLDRPLSYWSSTRSCPASLLCNDLRPRTRAVTNGPHTRVFCLSCESLNSLRL